MDGSFDLAAARPRQSLPCHVAVAIPVRNEASRLNRLLSALAVAAERSPCPVTALVLANNCSDDTAALARAFRHPALGIETVEIAFAAAEANAGRARRLAMDLAWREGALLMTTDGDATPAPDWIAAAFQRAALGADVVCGTIGTDARHVLATPSGARITAAEAAYGALVHEIRHALDQIAGRQPVGTPKPHYIESGASLAIRADAYAAIGGLPHVRSSEDRALVHLAERRGLAICYDDAMHAHVSARLFGRAEGGMAECLRRRMTEDDPLADQAMLRLPVLRQLWERAMAGDRPLFPDRSVPCGRRMRASDLERELPRLSAFVDAQVRPDAALWLGAMPAVAVA
ncbi:glycosyltransferase family 2 protein [Paracoccus sp. (in: a-proteobacteria)]|uniref:glycosyltransferase n=1 Tax=Paracoccus sp. TaxID=267 RepID=UPI0035B4A352